MTRVVEAINALGPERCILMSDAGQRHNPMPAEALRVFAQSVYESGISEEGVERMIKTNPLDLLELPPPPARPIPADRNGSDGRALGVTGAGDVA
jgi:hypothetical protein